MPAAKKKPTKKAPAKTSTKQLDDQGKIVRDKSGKFAAGTRTGTGFDAHPENRHNGRWSKENSISYWYNYFNGLTETETKHWLDKTPPEQRTNAQRIGYARVMDARKTNTRLALENTREITDRTEGKAPQVVTNLVRRSPLDDMDLSKEELMALAYGAEYTDDDINYDDEKSKGSQNADETSEDDEA